MIKTEREYQRCLKRISQHEKLMEEQRKELAVMGLNEEQVERGLAPSRYFGEKLRREAEEYERLKKGDFELTCTFDGIGRQLIAFRIYRGMSQAELAKKLGVTPPQVSRDERNEYGGASMEKVKQVLKALDMNVIIVPHEREKMSG